MAGLNEELFKEENTDSMELVFKKIFATCDNENKGVVDSSTLIKFITPFLESNDEHLCELKKILDPLNTNPILHCNSFSCKMFIWTAKIKNQLHTIFASGDKPEINKTLSDHERRHSTPTKESIENGTNRNDFDCGLNISNISSYSYAGSVQSACDPVMLNEQINELQHQNKKLLDLLNDVRSQLTTSEEGNNNLQSELEKLEKCRQADQKLIEDLQKIRIDYEKDREENNVLIKNCNSVTQSLNYYKKENHQLRKNILEFETEIQKNQEIINSFRHTENKQSAKIEKYKNEVQLKISEILSLQDKIAELNKIYEEKDSFVREITEELENLRYDNNALEKCLDDIKNKTSLKSVPVKSGKKFSPYFKNNRSSTPNSRLTHSKHFFSFDSPIYNSPKTLNMLSNPVSPIGNDSPTQDTSYNSNKSTVIEQYIDKNLIKESKDYFVVTCAQSQMRAFSENDALNQTSSSIDSETNPEKQASISLGPEAVFDDDCFEDKQDISRSPSPHESLQAELIKASNSECFGSHTQCEHKLKLIQCEEENVNLCDQIHEHVEYIDNMKQNISELNNLNTKLQSEILTLNEIKKCNEVLQEKVENYDKLLKENEEIRTLNIKLKSDIFSFKIENKRFSRYQQKLTKLEDEIFEEKNKKERMLMQNNALQLKFDKVSSHLEDIEMKKCDLEKQLSEKNNEAITASLENKELKTNINELTLKIQNLEETLLKENNCLHELQLKTNELAIKNEILEQAKYQLEMQLTKEKNNTKELKEYINQLSSEIDIVVQEKQVLKDKLFKEKNNVEILEQAKNQLKKQLTEEENNTKELKENINQLSSEIEIVIQEKQVLKDKLCKEENNVKELVLKVNTLKSDVQKLEKAEFNSNEQCCQAVTNIQELKSKIDILEQAKNELENTIANEYNATEKLKSKINDMCSNLEISEQTKYHLEDDLRKEKEKLQILSDLLNEIKCKNDDLESQNNNNLAQNKKLLSKIQNLENHMQNFRKSIIDLNTEKKELENNLKVISIEHESYINFIELQIKECMDILGRNTLLITSVWKSELQSVMAEIPASDLTDESSLLGVMQVAKGTATENLKHLRNQTRLTAILLKSLAKVKKNEFLEEEDAELSDVFSPDEQPLITQSTVYSNTQGFSLYFTNSSVPSPVPLPPMSPECTPSEMTEEEVHLSSVEPTDLGVAASSPTASVFIPEEQKCDNGSQQENGSEGAVVGTDSEDKSQKAPLKQHRSMSEGTSCPPLLTENGDITIFPNLQDLISLGLENGDESREHSNERLTEEEVEAKFQTLALIFAIDAKTLVQRRDLQKRQRDQAYDNFQVEVARLEHGIHRLAPLCVDAETKELVIALLTRLKILVKAADRISISTQVYGGVQQEFRIAAAVNLMLVHLRTVKQQRDTAKRQLQCTKKMLQENSSVSAEPSSSTVVVARRLSTANGRVVTRRRASIATIPRPLDSPSASGPAGIAAGVKRAVRRISAGTYSEHSVQPWDSRHRPDWMPLERPVQTRLSRPSRIELGLDLSKIHEGSIETTASNNEGSDSDFTSYETPTAVIPVQNYFLEQQPIVQQPETFSDHAVDVLTSLARFIMYCWNRWMQNGTTREMILFAMIICFMFGSILVLNIMIMSKFLRQGTVIQRIPWGWMTWDEVWSLFFDVRNTGPRSY